MISFYCYLFWFTSSAMAVQFIYVMDGHTGHTEQNETHNAKKLIIHGDEVLFPYEEFTGIPEEIKPFLQSLKLQHLQVEPNNFLASLDGCNHLETLTLSNVEWVGSFNRKVILPSLKQFRLYLDEVDAQTPEDFFKYIFFQNSADENSTTVPMNVSVYVNTKTGLKDLRYNSDLSELRVFRFPYDVSKYFNCIDLDYSISAYDLLTLNFDKLKSLRIASLKVLSDSDLKFLYNAVHLQAFVIYIFPQPNILPRVRINVATFKQLKILELTNARVKASDILELTYLQDLRLQNSEFTWDANISNITNRISKLSLEKIVFLNGSFNEFVKSGFNIKELRISVDSVYDGSNIFDLAQLNDSRLSLAFLTLDGFQLYSSELTVFKSLKSLALHSCSEVSKILKNLPISYGFVNLKQLNVRNISYPLFNKFVGNTSVEKLIISSQDVTTNTDLYNFLIQSSVQLFEGQIELVRSKSSLTGWTLRCAVEESTKFQKAKLRDYLLRIYIIVLGMACGIGLIGNCLTGIVLTRKSMRSSTSCVLLGLTLADSVILLTYAGSMLYFGIKFIVIFLKFNLPDGAYYVFSFEVTKEFIKQLDDIYYYLIYPLSKTAYTGSVYVTVLLTVERYIAVCWPLHAKRLLGLRKTTYILFVILVLSVLLNAPRWIEAQQSDTRIYDTLSMDLSCRGISKHLRLERVPSASGLLRYRYYRRYYHGVIWVTLMYVVPITALAFLNFRIWKQLKIASSNRSNIVRRNQNRDNEEISKITKMLLWVIAIFVLCNALSGIVVWILVGSGTADPADVEVISCIPLIINSSVNFIIYCLMGQKFRNELCRILPKWLMNRIRPRTAAGVSSNSERRSDTQV